MLAVDLLERSLGAALTPRSFVQGYSRRQLDALQPAPQVRFDAAPSPRPPPAGASSAESADGHEARRLVAHPAGTNAIAVDRFEGRYLISGGADGAISMWDLDAADFTCPPPLVHRPLGSVPRSTNKSTFGITALSYYTFDSGAFLSSSYDHHLRVYSSETLRPSASFSLNSVIYHHAISPIASHLLVACATQHPGIRLVDLNSGASTHTLVGHTGGAVLSVAWSPRDEYILASAGADGSVRAWDIRRSASSLGVLDMNDSVGIAGFDGCGTGARRRDLGRAHTGPANGLTWTEDGSHLVSTGHDERVRVWNMHNGSNTLANFGPIIRNKTLAACTPVLVPRSMIREADDVLFFPNEREILMYELYEGRLIKRLRPLGTDMVNPIGRRNQLTAVAWRPHSTELLSAHGDGMIRSWQPRTSLDAFVDEQDNAPDNAELSEGRKRKRELLDEIYRDLTQPKVTFI